MTEHFEPVFLHCTVNQCAHLNTVHRNVGAFIRDFFKSTNPDCANYHEYGMLVMSTKTYHYYWILACLPIPVHSIKQSEILYNPFSFTVHLAKIEGNTTYLVFAIAESELKITKNEWGTYIRSLARRIVDDHLPLI